MHEIDLRSDTVTLPTPAMRKAMYEAEVGDNVYGEDPTVNRLEEMVAERLDKEAALFVISGTMGNLVSLLTLCGRGEQAIMGDKAHVYLYEAGSVSLVGSIHVHIVPNLPNGMLDPHDVEAAIHVDKLHFPRSRVVCLENTHNRCGGVVLTPAQMATIKEIAQRHGLATYLDGARIFNAAVALGVGVREIAAQADAIQICFSKGLSAPVGSAIVGTADFIKEARRNCKAVGGYMRQAGVIAAAAVVALEQMVDRLAEDHENARILAEGLAEIDGLAVDLKTVQSDIVMVELTRRSVGISGLVEGLRVEGVKVNALDSRTLRAVTHYGIVREDIDAALLVFRKVMRDLA